MSGKSVVPVLGGGRPPAFFAGRTDLPDMNAAAQAGLQASFAVIGYKGRNWRIKYRGDEDLVKDARNVPVPSLDVVIVGISPHISKQYYEQRYSEGDDSSPDCFSLNGIAPDPTSPKLQCQTCAACPQNVFGSRVTEAGKKAKACQDSRRLAVVPSGDITNDTFGGPMLLRIPPMSLANLAKYTAEIGRYGAQPYMVRTVLMFNFDVAYPLIEFSADGWLTDDEAVKVGEALENPLIERVLETAEPEVATGAEAAPASPLAKGGPSKKFADKAPVKAPVQAQAPDPVPAIPQAPPPVAPQDGDEEAEEGIEEGEEEGAATHQTPEPEPSIAKPQAAKRPTVVAPAAPAKKPSPFAAKRAAAAPAQVQQTEEPAETKPNGRAAVPLAPADLQGAIENLLG